MRIYYDCEFLEDGCTIAPISIGMVAEDDRELYLINEEIEREPLYDRICKHTWLMANVVPHLPLATRYDGKPSIEQPGHENVHPRKSGHFNLNGGDNRIVGRRFLRNAVRDFIEATPEPELWAWYGAYDHVMYAQLFGRMIDLPTGFPMWTNDLRQEAHRLGLGEEEIIPAVPHGAGEHNALADARWNLRLDRWLTEWAVGGGNAR